MTLLRLLNVQGIAGIVVGIALGVLLIIQRGETRHWKKQSEQFEQLYSRERSALSGTIANYRAAAHQAAAADKANAERVEAEQASINERTSNAYQARVAAARFLAQRLRGAEASTDSGGRTAAAVPALPAPAGGPAQGPVENGLPDADALTATEQAIQLDELIQWVKAQAAIDPGTQFDQ